VRHGGHHGVENQVDLAADQVCLRLATAFVKYVVELHSIALDEHRRNEMAGGPISG
jgi:hypothetical protein